MCGLNRCMRNMNSAADNLDNLIYLYFYEFNLNQYSHVTYFKSYMYYMLLQQQEYRKS